jgi:signal transduction histidine kinase
VSLVRGHTVRSASIRVALAATGVVAVAYLLVAIAVVVITSQNLTGQIDASLRDTLAHVFQGPGGPNGGGGAGGGPYHPPTRDEPFNAPFIVWTIQAGGDVMSTDSSAVLPTAYYGVTSPVTVTIGGTTVRIAGQDTPDGDHVVVGQTMDSVSQAVSTYIVAEIGIAPALLLIVFLGAVTIGRRVAEPIERARERQMAFTADASHELRTPLSVIEAHTSLALAQNRSDAWYRSAFQRVDNESRRMRRLLDDMLWLARFDVATGQPHAEPIDVGVLAAQTVDRFGIVAEQRSLALTARAAPGSNVITVPPEWLDRLLGVLLDNACKYSPPGGSVVVTVASEGGRVMLTVDDSGPGIPADEREHIFDRFHRATDRTSGAGLGLAIGDAIVRATNGRWKIGTSPAGGASVSVSWPRSLGGPSGARETSESAAAALPGVAGGSAPSAAIPGTPARSE